jgi:hypothetical protein
VGASTVDQKLLRCLEALFLKEGVHGLPKNYIFVFEGRCAWLARETYISLDHKFVKFQSQC